MDTLLEMAYSMEDYNKTGGIWSKMLAYYTNLGVQADDIVMDLDVRARRSYKRISASITLSRAAEDGTWETVDTWELQEKGFLTFSTRLEKPEPGTYRIETEVRLGRSKEVIRSVYERYYEPKIPDYNPATDPNLNPVFSEEYGYYIP
jgi:hypothetical protein